MKVITEERLIEIRAASVFPDWVIEELFCELQKIDTLTVSKLRPMSDAPKDGKYFIVQISDEGGVKDVRKCRFYNGDLYSGDWCLWNNRYIDGWIPMPICKPEEK